MLNQNNSINAEKTMKTILFLVAFLSTGSLAFGGTTYYVQTSGSDASAGTSWAAAFATLQHALSAAASGDTIWVAAGTYTPSTSVATVSFQLKSGVAIYGGFAGTEIALVERNWQTNVTTLSGDIDNDGTLSGNSHHVVVASSLSGNVVLDGFTITGGNATDQAGGIEILFCSPTLSNLIISGNSALGGTAQGGGLWNFLGNPVLNNVTFSDNHASGFGGGMYSSNGTPSLTNCTFAGNSGSNGGGMYNSGNASISNCAFTGNTAVNGGGLYNDGSSVPTLTNTVFRNDTASSMGGGLYNNGNTLTPQNILFDGNHAASAGGGLVESGNSTYANITAYGNTSHLGGAFYVFGSGSPSIVNAIFWNDSATSKGAELYGQASGNVTISYTIVQGGVAGGGVLSDGTGSFLDGSHNFDLDPLFTDSSSHNFTLTASSPAIDSGKNNGVTAASDLAGNSRISDGTVDIGAYEYQGAPLAVEMTNVIATPSQNGVRLQWSTASEANNYGFDVERRAIGDFGFSIVDWKKVGFVTGAGTSAGPRTYSFLDSGVAPGSYDYRLKQVDRDGAFKYSSVVRIDAGSTPRIFSLSQNYPNPFNPTTTISYQLPTKSMVSLKIYDLLGREATTLVHGRMDAGAHQVSFDASKLASGTYFYSIQAENFTATKKMVLLK